jgi:hypothetical protein
VTDTDCAGAADIGPVVIAAWQAEATALFEAARSTFARVDQLLGFGATVLIAGAVAGLSQHYSQVLMFVAPTSLLLLTYACQELSDVAVLRAGRARIEDVLRCQLGTDVLMYESRLALFRSYKGGDKSIIATTVLHGAIAFVAVGGAVFVAVDKKASVVAWVAFGAPTVVGACAAALSARFLGVAYARALSATADWGPGGQAPRLR